MLYVQALGCPRPGFSDQLFRVTGEVIVGDDVGEALRVLRESAVDICVVDLADERAGLTAIRLLRARHPGLPLAGVVDASNSSGAIAAISAGLRDLLAWPASDDDVWRLVTDVQDRAAAPGSAAGVDRAEPVFAQSTAMRQALAVIERHALTRSAVCVVGQSGSGRTFLASTLHAYRHLEKEPFIRVDCSQRPAGLEAEVFGAIRTRENVGSAAPTDEVTDGSAITRSSGGTLFLANISDAPLSLQTRMAYVLSKDSATIGGRVFQRDSRLIVSLDRSPDVAVREGRLVPDLSNRIGACVFVPPLGERREDLPCLASHLLARAAARCGGVAATFSRAALCLVAALPWRGHARELESFVDLLARSVSEPVVQIDDVLARVRLDAAAGRTDEGLTLRDARTRFEHDCITAALARHHGRMGEAAKALGMERTNLYRKVRQLKVTRRAVPTAP